MDKRSTKRNIVAVRLTDDDIARIDHHAERMRERAPGIELSRTNIARALIIQALDAADTEKPKR